jgi:2-methylisocitrate lyase-like PEP mutase family enzyme
MITSTDISQIGKAVQFRQLHEREKLFIIPNAWDAGSAKILENLGFEAVATTSAGLAFSLAKPDAAKIVTREENLANANAIATATVLPVSVDLENGYGDDPESCAETILLAAKNGLVGCTLEDATGLDSNPIYDFDLSVERIKAAAKAARSVAFPFMLTARAENYLYRKPDLKDTVKRLVAFADAGADVLYAPGLKTKNEIEIIVKAVAPKPVNFLFGSGEAGINIKILEDIGVKRVSVGSSLARIAYSAFMHASKEIRDKGTFTFAKDAISYGELNKMFS